MSGRRPHRHNLSLLDYMVWRALALSYPEMRFKGSPDGVGTAAEEESLLETIGAGLRLSRRYQEQMVATLRELRALSKELGVSAARPLPQPSAATPRPDLGTYGIRFLCVEDATCAECGCAMPTGPLGWRRGDRPGPLCDPCLSELSPTLAAILIAINMLREAGWIECSRDEDEATVGGMVLTTALLYEQQHFQAIPLRGIDVETGIIPALRKLDDAYQAVEVEDPDDTVTH